MRRAQAPARQSAHVLPSTPERGPRAASAVVLVHSRLPVFSTANSERRNTIFCIWSTAIAGLLALVVWPFYLRSLLYSQAPEMSATHQLLKTIVVPPASGKRATATLIFAHGLGDTGAGWYDVAQMLSARPALQHVRFVLPNAPVVPVSLNMGMKMPSWFDITTLDDVQGAEDEAGLLKSADAIKALVDAEIDGSASGLNGQGVASERVVVGGFSQGGAIALLAGLTKTPSVAGVIALSTWLPLRAKLVAPFLPSHAETLPVFMGHGTADPVVRFDFGERSAKFLRAGDGGGQGLGLGKFRQTDEGRWRGVWQEAYPGMPHSACADEIEHLGQFLEKVVPASSDE